MKYLLILLTLAACQVDESDNYYRYSGGSRPAPFFDEMQGHWCNGQECVRIDGLAFCCDAGGYTQQTIKAFEQKYFQLDYQACGYGPSIPFMLRPPYDTLSLMRGGKWIVLWKHYSQSLDSCTP